MFSEVTIKNSKRLLGVLLSLLNNLGVGRKETENGVESMIGDRNEFGGSPINPLINLSLMEESGTKKGSIVSHTSNIT